MSQPSIDYIVSLLSEANKKISKQKSKSKVAPETNEIIAKLQLEIDSLKKSLSESNEFIVKLQLEIDSPKKSLLEANETIAKLQSEKAEILDNIMGTFRKYNSRYSHVNNISKFNKIIKNKKFHKLLNFERFDLKLLFKDIGQILNMDDKIIIHIIDNCINLEEISNDSKYKLIHYFVVIKNMKLDIIKYLIDKNIDLLHQNIWGNTPLHLSCFNLQNSGAKKDVIEYLIEKTDKIDIKNNDGLTPVQLLTRNPNITNGERKILVMKFEAKQK